MKRILFILLALTIGLSSCNAQRNFAAKKLLLSLSSACTIPTVTTTSITNIQPFSAISGGNITSDGGCAVVYRGVCWNTSTNPTTANSHTTDGSGTGTFTSTITGLTCGTTYHVRAYASNSSGTAYGSEVDFTTSLTNVPVVNFITGFNSTSCGNVTVNSDATAGTVCTTIQQGMNVSPCYITQVNGQNLRCENVNIGYQIWGYNVSACQLYVNMWYVYGSGGVFYKIHTNSSGVIDTKTQCYP